MNVVLAIIAILASLYLLAVLTEDFFIPAIDRIAQKLRMSSDAAAMVGKPQRLAQAYQLVAELR